MQLNSTWGTQLQHLTALTPKIIEVRHQSSARSFNLSKVVRPVRQKIFDYHRSKNYRYINTIDKRTASSELGRRRASTHKAEQLIDTQGQDKAETDPVY